VKPVVAAQAVRWSCRSAPADPRCRCSPAQRYDNFARVFGRATEAGRWWRAEFAPITRPARESALRRTGAGAPPPLAVAACFKIVQAPLETRASQTGPVLWVHPDGNNSNHPAVRWLV